MKNSRVSANPFFTRINCRQVVLFQRLNILCKFRWFYQEFIILERMYIIQRSINKAHTSLSYLACLAVHKKPNFESNLISWKFRQKMKQFVLITMALLPWLLSGI